MSIPIHVISLARATDRRANELISMRKPFNSINLPQAKIIGAPPSTNHGWSGICDFSASNSGGTTGL